MLSLARESTVLLATLARFRRFHGPGEPFDKTQVPVGQCSLWDGMRVGDCSWVTRGLALPLLVSFSLPPQNKSVGARFINFPLIHEFFQCRFNVVRRFLGHKKSLRLPSYYVHIISYSTYNVHDFLGPVCRS